MKVCQYPYLLSTKFFPSNQRKNLTFFFSLFRPFPTKNIFLKNLFQNLFPKTKKCLILKMKMKSPAIPPNLSEKLIPPTQFQKIPEWNILKGKKKLPLKDLEFYKSEILSQIPLAQITRKKVRDFCKASRWRVNGNEHTIFNYIIDPVGNDFLPYEDLEDFLIDDFKRFSLAYDELNLPRKRFLNCHHVLFWLLKKNGFHPKEEDFKLLILPQKRAEQEKIIQTIFKKYNWKENGVPK